MRAHTLLFLAAAAAAQAGEPTYFEQMQAATSRAIEAASTAGSTAAAAASAASEAIGAGEWASAAAEWAGDTIPELPSMPEGQSTADWAEWMRQEKDAAIGAASERAASMMNASVPMPEMLNEIFAYSQEVHGAVKRVQQQLVAHVCAAPGRC